MFVRKLILLVNFGGYVYIILLLNFMLWQILDYIILVIVGEIFMKCIYYQIFIFSFSNMVLSI